MAPNPDDNPGEKKKLENVKTSEQLFGHKWFALAHYTGNNFFLQPIFFF